MTQPILAAARLDLVPVLSFDCDLLLAHWSHTDVSRYLWDGRQPAREAVLHLVEASLSSAASSHFGLWCLRLRPSSTFLGVCGIRDGERGPELVYSLDPEHRGSGFAEESARSVLDYWFGQLGNDVLAASVDEPNAASIRVLERLGFTKTVREIVNGNPVLLFFGIPMKTPFDPARLPWQVWYEGSDREVRGKALCDRGGPAKVGVGLMELPAGSHTRPAHYHTREEEHLYGLEGSATLHLGTDVFVLVPGSYVCFPAGSPQPHHLHNTTAKPFRYLMIGERIADDVVVYPDADQSK